jgi:hypothetical protein
MKSKKIIHQTIRWPIDEHAFIMPEGRKNSTRILAKSEERKSKNTTRHIMLRVTSFTIKIIMNALSHNTTSQLW